MAVGFGLAPVSSTCVRARGCMNEQHEPDVPQVPVVACQHSSSEAAAGAIQTVEAAAMAALWSGVGKQAPQRW
jgi:hypothetical protein